MTFDPRICIPLRYMTSGVSPNPAHAQIGQRSDSSRPDDVVVGPPGSPAVRESLAEQRPTEHPPPWRIFLSQVARTLGVVRIEIWAEPGAPPSGVVRVDGEGAHTFDGWLALLRLLADVLDAQPPPGLPTRRGGEFASGGHAELGEGM